MEVGHFLKTRYHPPSRFMLAKSCVYYLLLLQKFLLIMGSVDFEAVSEAVQKGSRIIDVRSRDEFNSGHIPGSVNVPLADLEAEFSLSDSDFQAKFGMAKPGKEAEIITSCKMGGRASRGKDTLLKMGYSNVLVYAGSWLDWEKNGGKIEK